MDSRPMLNLYPDSMGGDLEGFCAVLDRAEFSDAFSAVYLLPSIYHSDLDRGFSVIDYNLEEKYKTEEALKKIREKGIYLKLDFVLNHASVQSPQFQDLLEKGKDSEYRDFFIDWNAFWEGCGEMTEDGYILPEKKYLDKMFFRKPGLPFLMVEFADGSRAPYWNTFYQEIRETNDYHSRYLGQMDLNILSQKVWDFYRETIEKLAGYGAKIIRLDAFAYAPKRPGEKNFLNEPDTWELLEKIKELTMPFDMALLPEIHAGYEEKRYEIIAEKGYLTYDFFLPGLLIDAIARQDGSVLAAWAMEQVEKGICSVTMLGCHDGIPVLDLKGLLPDERIQELIELLVKRGGYVKDLHGNKSMYYQVNTTYFNALGKSEAALLLARAIQLFMPGKPQVWYLDLFAGENDYEAVKAAGAGGHKEINRTNLSAEEIIKRLEMDVVKKQLQMLRFRNTFPAFGFDAHPSITCSQSKMSFSWQKDGYLAELKLDFVKCSFLIEGKGKNGEKVFCMEELVDF
ncbi:MAG: sucrose phosphorylase [Lachnospiraceae bacterium]|nr:sucrose phosphorylase [Lachnospiraceae bacterium]